MPSHQGTQNIGSGNDELRGPGIPAFLVVEHNGQKAAIKRQSDYQKTIASIKKSIHELGSSQDDHIILLGFLAEVDDYVRITEEVWADLLPRFLTIRVQLRNAPKNPPVSTGTRETGKDDSSENEIVHRAEEEDVLDTSDTSLRQRIIEMRQQAAAHAKFKDDEEAEKRCQQQAASETSGWAAFLHPPRSEPSETVTINDRFETVPGRGKWRPSPGRGIGRRAIR